jgi:hypothetical protein
MSSDKEKFACRICGKMQDDPPWGDDNLAPTYNICGCCGVEFGYQDCILEAILAYRKKWIGKGAKWECPQEKPANWSLEEQMRNVPAKYR